MEGAVSGSGEGIVERSPTGRYLRFAEKLGSGSWKQVYRAYDTREGIEVAWNVVNLTGVPKYERNRIINEVRLLERLVHPNIISFHGSWVNRERQEVHFITEILSAGSLKSFIMKVQVIRWKIAKRWLKQILEGLAYMHSQGVIHRDLKCENIFIDGPSGDLRIGDMGLCTILRGNGPTLSVLGTPEFMAPDMYEEHISYDEKIDIYSFGMCMIELCTHETPYIECSDPTQIYRKVSNGEHPQSLNRIRSPEARNFILLCIGGKDGSGKFVRPSAVQLLSHPFLSADDADDDIIRIDPANDKNSVPTKSTMTVATSTTATASGVSALKDAPETKEKGGQEKQQVGGNASGGAADAKKEPEPEPERQEQKELSGVGSPSPSATSSVASRATPSTGSAASRATSSSGSAASKPTTSGGSRTSKASFSAGSALGSRASKAIVPHESPGVTKTTPQTTSQGSKAATVATTSSALSQMSFSSQQTEVTAEEMMQYQLHRQHLQQEQLKHQQLQLQQLHLNQQQLQQQQYQQQLPQQQLLQQFQLQQLAQQQQLQQQFAQQQQLQQQLAQQQQRQQLQQQPQPQPPQPQPQPPQPQPQPQQKKQKHFLVAAAILERADAEEGGMFSGQGTQPTVLPLVLTFPVQGRNQDVQFDFDLVQDDPIKVAREMVEDLGIPSDAVLEISETISGLANAARIKREARTQVLQQEQVDKEELLVQQMRDLTTQNMEQLEQQEQQQLQIDQQQEQIDMQAQQHQDQKEALLKQQQNILLLEAKRKANIEAEQGVVASPGSEGASGVVGKDKEKDSSSDEGEFNKELARIDEGYLFSMAQARQVYDNRIIGLQKEQDERERLHLDAVEQHEKDKADFHDLVKETQREENRRVDDLQREWDERREQLAKQPGN